MTRELAAVLLLILLILGSWLNLRYLDTLTGALEEELILSRSLAESGRTEPAVQTLLEALDMWLNADGYTHVFIRHSEIDAISDAFYELYGAMLGGEADELDAAFGKLLYHLHSVNEIEHLSLRSIL